MPTPTNIGIDIARIVGPLVDLGFGLAGAIKVSAQLHLNGVKTLNTRTDARTETGAIDVTVPAFLVEDRENKAADLNTRLAVLIINPSDLVAAGVLATREPRIDDTARIGNDVWTVYGRAPVPATVVHKLYVRK